MKRYRRGKKGEEREREKEGKGMCAGMESTTCGDTAVYLYN